MEINYLFSFQMMYNLNFTKLTLMTGFVVQGHKCHLGETLKFLWNMSYYCVCTQRVSLLLYGVVDPPGDVGHGLRHPVGFSFDLRSDWWVQWRLLLMHRKSQVWAMDSRFLPERTNMQWHHEPDWSHQYLLINTIISLCLHVKYVCLCHFIFIK